MASMPFDVVHVCAIDEPEPPDPDYLRNLDELLDLRVDHLPVLGKAGPWRLYLMDLCDDSDEWEASQQGAYPMPEGLYTALFRGEPIRDNLWMSDIPREIWSMWDAIEELKKPHNHRVLITGLGLGVILKHALRQPHITRIDVVELDADVIRLIRPHYCDRRLHVHHGDALTIDLRPRSTWDFAYHDFWKNITAANLPTMFEVMTRYAGRVGRQFCWEQARCFELARKEGDRWGLPFAGIAAMEQEFALLGKAVLV